MCCSQAKLLYILRNAHLHFIHRTMTSKKIDFTHLKGFKDHLAVIIATFFYSGTLPKAPGTWGSLAALPLVFLLNQYSDSVKLIFWFSLFLLGTWSSHHIQKIFQISDNQNIVIDEVVGVGITAWMIGTDIKWLFVSFILFRFFDIAKLPPVRWFDRLSKSSTNLWVGGLGVMMDDVIAGLQGLVLIYFLKNQIIPSFFN